MRALDNGKEIDGEKTSNGRMHSVYWNWESKKARKTIVTKSSSQNSRLYSSENMRRRAINFSSCSTTN